jgi:hypothetical protein
MSMTSVGVSRREMFLKIALAFNGAVGVLLGIPVMRYLLSPMTRGRKELIMPTAPAHPARRSAVCSNTRSKLSMGTCTSGRARCPRPVLPPPVFPH